MKFILLCASLFVLAAAKPSGRSPRGLNYIGYMERVAATSGNPAEIAALFPDIDPKLANDLAEALLAAGLGLPLLQKPVVDADPEMVWTGVEAVIRTMLNSVPAGCADAISAHSAAGFARHIIMEVLMKDFIHVVEECTEICRINSAMGGRPDVVHVPSPEQWQAMVNELKRIFDSKLAAWSPATGTVHMEDFFGGIMTEIDLLALKDEPIATVLAKIAAVDKSFMGIFTGTPSTCAITGSIADIAPHAMELPTLLTNDIIALINQADLPAGVKPIIIKKLTDIMSMVAADLGELIQAYQGDNVAAYIIGIMREVKEEIAMVSGIGRLVNGIVTPDLITFVNEKIAAGETEKLLKTIMRTVALTLADLDLDEQAIEMRMDTILKVVMGDPALMHMVDSRFFSFSGGLKVDFW